MFCNPCIIVTEAVSNRRVEGDPLLKEREASGTQLLRGAPLLDEVIVEPLHDGPHSKMIADGGM